MAELICSARRDTFQHYGSAVITIAQLKNLRRKILVGREYILCHRACRCSHCWSSLYTA